jgi:O-antigen ligase
MTFGSMEAIVLTFSRGAALGLGVLIVLMTLHSKKRLQTFIVMLVLGLVPVFALVSESYFARIQSINAYQADSSSLGRIHLMKSALWVWRTHPWFGVGLEDREFMRYSDPYLRSHNYLGTGHVVHNSFLWMLAHTGIVGVGAFTYLLGMTLVFTARSARKMAREAPELAIYPRILTHSLIAYLIGSVTHPRATFDLLYMIVMYTAAWWVVSTKMRTEKTAPSVTIRVSRQRPLQLQAVRAALPGRQQY